jgi:hypothetical protein
MKRPSVSDPVYPQTFEEAVDYLLEVMEPASRRELSSLSFEALNKVARDYCLSIRSILGLWGQNPDLINSLPEKDRFPDNASALFFEAVWKRLNPMGATEQNAETAVRTEWVDFILCPNGIPNIRSFRDRLNLSLAADPQEIAEKGWDYHLQPHVIYRFDIESEGDSFEAVRVDRYGDVTIWTTHHIWLIRNEWGLRESLHSVPRHPPSS